MNSLNGRTGTVCVYTVIVFCTFVLFACITTTRKPQSQRQTMQLKSLTRRRSPSTSRRRRCRCRTRTSRTSDIVRCRRRDPSRPQTQRRAASTSSPWWRDCCHRSCRSSRTACSWSDTRRCTSARATIQSRRTRACHQYIGRSCICPFRLVAFTYKVKFSLKKN